MMKGIITVVGKDQVGIIGKVCTLLSENQINILDISQTILQGYFNMMMIVDLSQSVVAFDQVVDALEVLGKAIEVDIRLQHEHIFDSMHRI
ncbi:MAG: ACT domain-containing protein [Niameybacter sp.]